MPTKSQSVSRAKQRTTRNPIESRSNENTITNQLNDQPQNFDSRRDVDDGARVSARLPFRIIPRALRFHRTG